jgi:hypothetical protein
MHCHIAHHSLEPLLNILWKLFAMWLMFMLLRAMGLNFWLFGFGLFNL